MFRGVSALLLGGILLGTTGCSKPAVQDPNAGAPPAAKDVVTAGDPSLVHLENADRFPLVEATAYKATSALHVTGQVQADPSREIPVVSLANGRVVATYVRLGDTVHKGQLVMEVQSTDISNAFGQYVKAQNDERLARTVLERNQLLFSQGAIAKSQVDTAQDAEDDAQSDLRAAEQQLHVLGVDPNHPGQTLKVYAPASGVITQQNVTESSTAGNGLLGTPNAFMIADLSHVWVVCDVYENDLGSVHLGQETDIQLNAYPDKEISGTVGEIGAEMDPSLRTAKVRIQVSNASGLMRLGMFATATFHGKTMEDHAAVPATAILHLHDRDWVYVPTGRQGEFQRVGVVSGLMIPGGMQEITSGLTPGQQVVRNALELQNTAAQ